MENEFGKLDLRYISDETKHEIRKQVVVQRKQGLPNREVAINTRLTESQTSRIWTLYKNKGKAGIKPKQRGRKQGKNVKLLKEQQSPDEYLNNALKQSVHSGIRAHTAVELESKTQSFMRRLQHNPSRVASFFYHKNVRFTFCDI